MSGNVWTDTDPKDDGTSFDEDAAKESASDPNGLLSTREQLAEYAHNAWAGWMKYMLEKTIETGDGCEEIPAWAVERWTRQMNTAYKDLPEDEKISDRKEADEMLKIMGT